MENGSRTEIWNARETIKWKILHINSFPLIPAETAFRGSLSYRPISPSLITPLTGRNRPPGRPPKPCCLDKSIPCAKRWRYIHTLHTRYIHRCTMFTNNFCACQSSPFTDIRLICSVFVEFITSFLHVLTCFNGCVAAMDAQLGFGTRLRWFCDRFVTVGFGENERFAVALGSGSDVD